MKGEVSHRRVSALPEPGCTGQQQNAWTCPLGVKLLKKKGEEEGRRKKGWEGGKRRENSGTESEMGRGWRSTMRSG